MSTPERPTKTLVQNRKVSHDYFIRDVFEAGIELHGSEVKSIRGGRANIGDAFVRVEGGQMFLVNANIQPNTQTGTYFQHEPARPRRLLMKRKEINRIMGNIEREGLSCVALRLYAKGSLIKCEVALVQGKKAHDKRQSEADRQWQRDKGRIMRDKG